MTVKLAVLRQVFRARQHLRDQAASTVSLAQDLERQRRVKSEDAVDRRAKLVAGTGERLKDACSVADLELLAVEIETAEQEVIRTETDVHEATRERLRRAEELRLREKDVRVAEKLIEQSKRQTAKQVSKQEQRLTDDVAGRLKRRRND